MAQWGWWPKLCASRHANTGVWVRFVVRYWTYNLRMTKSQKCHLWAFSLAVDLMAFRRMVMLEFFDFLPSWSKVFDEILLVLWFWTSNHIIAGHVTIALRRFPWACVRSIDMPTGCTKWIPFAPMMLFLLDQHVDNISEWSFHGCHRLPTSISIHPPHLLPGAHTYIWDRSSYQVRPNAITRQFKSLKSNRESALRFNSCPPSDISRSAAVLVVPVVDGGQYSFSGRHVHWLVIHIVSSFSLLWHTWYLFDPFVECKKDLVWEIWAMPIKRRRAYHFKIQRTELHLSNHLDASSFSQQSIQTVTSGMLPRCVICVLENGTAFSNWAKPHRISCSRLAVCCYFQASTGSVLDTVSVSTLFIVQCLQLGESLASNSTKTCWRNSVSWSVNSYAKAVLLNRQLGFGMSKAKKQRRETWQRWFILSFKPAHEG